MQVKWTLYCARALSGENAGISRFVKTELYHPVTPNSSREQCLNCGIQDEDTGSVH